MGHKKVLITGASGGIGSQLCKQFLENGHEVWAVYRNADKFHLAFSSLSSEIKKGLHPVKLDLMQANGEVLDKLWELEFGSNIQIDIVINNAGLLIYKPFHSFSEQDVEQLLQINFKAPMLMIQTLLPFLKKPSHIVNISTMGAFQGSVRFSGLSLYGATKGALQCLTETLAVELQTEQVSVNALAIGAVQTPMLESAFPNIKDAQNPAEMAKFILDFALNGMKYFNGKVLPVSSSTP